jgi:PhnB protein
MAQLHPYLSFNGNARQAIAFYQGVFGGKVTMSTYAEFQMSQDPAEGNKIMHSTLEADNGIAFMASDSPSGNDYKRGNTMSMSLSGTDEAELRGYWDKLSEGGTINLPLEKAPWGDAFGMLTDKFGVDWMVNITAQKG